MASVVMYVQCIGTWYITCFITFDDLSGHLYLSSYILMFLLVHNIVSCSSQQCCKPKGKILCGPRSFASPALAQNFDCSVSNL